MQSQKGKVNHQLSMLHRHVPLLDRDINSITSTGSLTVHHHHEKFQRLRVTRNFIRNLNMSRMTDVVDAKRGSLYVKCLPAEVGRYKICILCNVVNHALHSEASYKNDPQKETEI